MELYGIKNGLRVYGKFDILQGNGDPSTSGCLATVGSEYHRLTDGSVWHKTGATNYDWSQGLTSSSGTLIIEHDHETTSTGGQLDHKLALTNIGTKDHDQIDSHIANTSNPHAVTKTQVGLSNVPNLDSTSAINDDHTHANKTTLDNIQEALTTALKSGYDASVLIAHQHNNSGVLNAIDTAFTSVLKLAYDNAVILEHNHSNKITLDSTQEAFTTALKNAYDGAVIIEHSHSNSGVLNAIEQAFTTALKNSYDSAYAHISLTNNPHATTASQVGITSGNLTATSPLHQTGGTGSILGTGVSLTIDDATTSAKGVTQLSNSYSGSLQTQATTEKALSEGLATKQASIGYTPENIANKATSTSLGTSDAYYPSQNAVKTYVDTHASSVTSGNLSATSPLNQVGGVGAVIGTGVALTIDDASTNVKGAVQLSNSYSGILQTKAVTEKALSDGLATVGSGITSGTLSESTSSVLTITGGTGAVIGTGTTVQVKQANAGQSGYLSSGDFSTFNLKQNALTSGNLTESTSSVLTIGNGSNSVIGTGTTIQVKQASGGQDGYLSSGDWTIFNNKGSGGGSVTSGNLTETGSSVLTITGGTNAVMGSGTTVQVKQATTGQSGYLSSGDWNTFSGKQNAVTSGSLTESTSSVLTLLGLTGAVLGSGGTIQVKKSTTGQDGYLASADFTAFNNKQNSVTSGNLTEATSSVLTITGGTSSVFGSGTSIQVKQASASQDGYLASGSFITFTNKQNALTNPVTGTGSNGQVAQFNGTSTIIGVAENTAFNVNFETATANIKPDGSVSVGALSTIARADHIHATDTSRQATLTNPVTGTGSGDQVAQFNGTTTITGVNTLTAFNKNFGTDPAVLKMNGVAAVGTSGTLPRSDHVHPTDTSRQATLSIGNLSESTSSVLTISGTGATIGNATIQVKKATAGQSGYLDSGDFSTFSGKQNALTNPVTGTGANTNVVLFTGTTTVSGSAVKTGFNLNLETDANVFKADGIASCGTSGTLARADHVHPAGGGLAVFTTQNVVTGSRAIDSTPYQNLTGKTMMVVVSFTGGAGWIYARSDSAATPTVIVASASGNGVAQSMTFMVLDNNYYSVGTVASLDCWVEYY